VKILQHIRALLNGKLNGARFGVRMHGEGVFADHIAVLFTLGCRKAGLQPKDLSGCPPRPFAVSLAHNSRCSPRALYAGGSLACGHGKDGQWAMRRSLTLCVPE
jgi:hypothetical protein